MITMHDESRKRLASFTSCVQSYTCQNHITDLNSHSLSKKYKSHIKRKILLNS